MSLVSPNHGLYVVTRAKREFKANASLADTQEAQDQLQLARVLLDSLKVQNVSPTLGQHRSAVPGTMTSSKSAEDFW